VWWLGQQIHSGTRRIVTKRNYLEKSRGVTQLEIDIANEYNANLEHKTGDRHIDTPYKTLKHHKASNYRFVNDFGRREARESL
jgi:hypothetical protein